MKIKVSLFIFFVSLLFGNCSVKPSKKGKKSGYQDYFYVKSLPASSDLLQFLKYKSGPMKYSLVTVNKNLLFFSDAIKKKQVLGKEKIKCRLCKFEASPCEKIR